MVRNARVLALVVLLGTAGCYEYHAVDPADAVMDTRVRATVSAEKAAELAPALRNVSTSLSGTLVERDGQSLLMEVPLLGTGTDGTDPLHTRVKLDPGDLVSLESRTLSKWRTATVVAALLAAVGTGWTVINGSANAVDKPGAGIDNARILVPIFRFTAGGG